jgi:membrane protease YdiL (CAAX protease family)
MPRPSFASKSLDVGWCLGASAGVVGVYLALALGAAVVVPEPITATILLGIVVLIVIAAVRVLRPKWLAYTPVVRPLRDDSRFIGHALGTAVLAFFAGQSCAVWLYSMLGSENFDASIQSRQSAGVVLTLVLTLVVAPASEEALFRGLLYPLLRKRLSILVSALVTAGIFGVVHGNIVQFTAALPLAIVLALVYERTRKLWLCVLLHLGFNLAASSVLAPVVSVLANPVSALMLVAAFIGVCWSLGRRVTRALEDIEA